MALPFVPLGAKLAATTELAALPVTGNVVHEFVEIGGIANTDWVGDITATTIESRSRRIADNVYKNNLLLQRLRSTTPEQRRAAELARWKSARWACYRHDTVRIDSRCPSGYAQWRDTWAS